MSRGKHRTLDYKSRGTGEVIRVPTQSHSDAADSVLQFFAVLAYPHASERSKRDPFARAMHVANYKARIWNQRKNKHDSAAVRALVPPEYRLRIRTIQGQMNKGFKRISRRLNAGSCAACFYYKGAYRYNRVSPSGKDGVVVLGPNTVRKALRDAVRVREEQKHYYREPDDAAENERKHTWLLSMPVLHLCFILSHIIEGFPEATSSEAMLFDLVEHPEWLHDALLKAEGIRMILHECVPEFDPDKALRLLPSEPLSEPTT